MKGFRDYLIMQYLLNVPALTPLLIFKEGWPWTGVVAFWGCRAIACCKLKSLSRSYKLCNRSFICWRLIGKCYAYKGVKSMV